MSLGEELRRLGVAAGDRVMVHASMRQVGGRAETLVQALDDAVGDAGTLLMMTGPTNDDPFDCLVTPSDPDNGVLSEIFRTTPGTLSSNHPEGRFSARGAQAAHFISDVPWDDYYGPGSPLQRLVDAGGRVLRLGADIETVTLLHYAEYLADLPSKRRVTRERLITTTHGSERRGIHCLDDQFGIVDWAGEDYFGLILLAYLSSHQARHGLIGRAPSELIDARDLTMFAVEWMETHFRRE